jgi:hypothetical protein
MPNYHISFPDMVTNAPWGKYVSYFSTVAIQRGVTNIGKYAFFGCGAIDSIDIAGTVTTIGSNAFNACYGLTSVNIGNNVTTIGNGTFQNCSNLTSVSIGNNITTIGNMAFSGCIGLTSVIIPNNVTTIGIGAFQDCSNLTSVNIGNNVTTIGSSAFEGTAWYNNQPNGVVYVGKVLYKYKGNMPVDTEITILEGALGIANDAFRDCSNLISVNIPNSVITIGDYAFQNCSSLTSVTIPNSVITIGGYAFRDCSNLISVSIPTSVTTIGWSAFQDCSSLTSITIPNSVITIGSQAFSGCTGITTISIGSSLTSPLNNIMPLHNDSLISIHVDDNNSVYASENGVLFNKAKDTLIRCPGAKQGNYTIPNSVTTIQNVAFWNCSGLTSITIGNGVTSLPSGLFQGCCSLTSLTLPFIGTSANATGTNATLGALFGTTINSDMQAVTQFYNATQSNTYYLPKNLTKLVITNATEIGYGALYSCNMLKEVTFPSTLTSIGEHALYNCTGLEHIYSERNNPPVAYENTTFNGVDKFDCVLHVPAGREAQYRFANGWKEFFNIREDAGLPQITTTTLPNGTTGTAYSATLVATGDNLTWSIDNGNLPNGLSINATTGVISGTPAVAGTFNFTVKVSNSGGDNTKVLSITIIPKIFTVTVNVNNSTYGTASGGGIYNENDVATLTATANSGYYFMKWSDGNIYNPRTITVAEDITLTAIFEFEGIGEITDTVEIPNGQTIVVVPDSTTAQVAWKANEGATGYIITIYNASKTEIICSLELDAMGRLIGITFKKHETKSEPVFAIKITNLSENTTYFYKMETLGENSTVIDTKEGTFKTLGGEVGINDISVREIRVYPIRVRKKYKVFIISNMFFSHCKCKKVQLSVST